MLNGIKQFINNNSLCPEIVVSIMIIHLSFYVPHQYSGGHIVFALSVGLFVCLCVCVFASNFNICHNFCNIADSNLIFGMHVYLMELHILSGERSRSSFKVKGQIYCFKAAQKGT
jgi:hypothetical protein